MDAFDMVVIGARPAGEKGAAQAAYWGKRVAMVDRAETPGGRRFETPGPINGRTVNIAARIADYARPGEVLVSQEVVDAGGGRPVTFTEMGRWN